MTKSTKSADIAEDISMWGRAEQDLRSGDSLCDPSESRLDESLLVRACTQWQLGDWESLVQVSEDDIRDHPERAKLALLAGAAWLQLDGQPQAEHLVRTALSWGCSKSLVARVLVSGVHNSLGRARALTGEYTRAIHHFQESVTGLGGDRRLACQVRSLREFTRAGLSSDTRALIDGLTDAGYGLGEEQAGRSTPVLGVPDGPESTELRRLVESCLGAEDVRAAVDRRVHRLPAWERFWFYCELSRRLRECQDNVTALHYLGCARELGEEAGAAGRAVLARRYINAGKSDIAVSIMLEASFDETDFLPGERDVLRRAIDQVSEDLAKGEHGHALLMEALRRELPGIRRRLGKEVTPVLLEIGSTREEVPGQGSTRKLAGFCATEALHFITVDMDPHNTAMAQQVFRKMDVPFEAITGTGEDYLRRHEGRLDFVFLDAYDFDHGKHSELRQRRYRRLLGGEISDEACHRMHLECAEAIAERLPLGGLVCMDDTWQEDGEWAAKGTLAVPYLLEKGFELVEARNRAALLRRA